MALITWGPKLEIGVKIIDEQHRGLIDLINRLHDAKTKGRGAEVMAGIFGELLKYTQVHFGEEEALMQEHGYDEYPEHYHDHGTFIAQMDMYRVSFEDGSKTVDERVLDYLRNWLLTHITTTDRGYVSLFKAAGMP